MNKHQEVCISNITHICAPLRECQIANCTSLRRPALNGSSKVAGAGENPWPDTSSEKSEASRGDHPRLLRNELLHRCARPCFICEAMTKSFGRECECGLGRDPCNTSKTVYCPFFYPSFVSKAFAILLSVDPRSSTTKKTLFVLTLPFRAAAGLFVAVMALNCLAADLVLIPLRLLFSLLLCGCHKCGLRTYFEHSYLTEYADADSGRVSVRFDVDEDHPGRTCCGCVVYLDSQETSSLERASGSDGDGDVPIRLPSVYAGTTVVSAQGVAKS